MGNNKKSEYITPEQISLHIEHLKKLSNSAKYKQAQKLSYKLMKQHPQILMFARYEAVMGAEDVTGLTKGQANRKFKIAAKKLRSLTTRLRGVSPELRISFQNEYFWFSKQPYKQFQLGIRTVKNGMKKGYYSQGVGAAMLAKKYGENGQIYLMLKWAKISQLAWKNFYRHYPNWFNGYFYYAMAYGFQGKTKEMESCFERVANISGNTSRWKPIAERRKLIEKIISAIK